MKTDDLIHYGSAVMRIQDRNVILRTMHNGDAYKDDLLTTLVYQVVIVYHSWSVGKSVSSTANQILILEIW